MDILSLNRLEELFLSQGYDKIPSNLPEFIFYCRREAQGINVLYVIDYRQGLYISADQYEHIKKKIIDFFQARGEHEIHVMALVLCADTEKARQAGMAQLSGNGEKYKFSPGLQEALKSRIHLGQKIYQND